jgi:phosphatidylserine synthase
LAKLWHVLSTPLAAVLVLAGYVILRRVLTDERNHWAADIRVLVVPSIMLLSMSVFGFVSRKTLRIPAVLFGVLAILITALVFVLDHWNVLVQYEAWLDRGMPERWMQ